MVPNGKVENTSNSWTSVAISKTLGFLSPASIPVTPKTLNQTIPITVGTNNTAIMNSLIVRPLDTRAINIPTNGLQLIHQPQ